MKTMTCKQLGGACEQTFQANSFEELTEMSKLHGMEMFQKGDPAHIEVISTVMSLMANPVAMEQWIQEKRDLFNSLPQD